MSNAGESRVYTRSDCIVFRKTSEPFGGLSNMAPGYPVEVNGIRTSTVEALYQACRFPHMADVQRMIRGQHSPMTAKMKMKRHRDESRSDWDEVRIVVMRWCLRVKLVQNWEKFSTLLMSTSGHPIVESSRRDDFWGTLDDGPDNLVGRNVLGRLLMELRETVNGLNGTRWYHVWPPHIPSFLLIGEPIGVIEAPTRGPFSLRA